MSEILKMKAKSKLADKTKSQKAQTGLSSYNDSFVNPFKTAAMNMKYQQTAMQLYEIKKKTGAQGNPFEDAYNMTKNYMDTVIKSNDLVGIQGNPIQVGERSFEKELQRKKWDYQYSNLSPEQYQQKLDELQYQPESAIKAQNQQNVLNLAKQKGLTGLTQEEEATARMYEEAARYGGNAGKLINGITGVGAVPLTPEGENEINPYRLDAKTRQKYAQAAEAIRQKGQITYEDADKANALQEQLGVPVVTVSSGSKGVFDERARTSLTLLGKVLGKEDKATTLCNYILAQKAELEARTADVQDGPSVYICGLGNWGKTNHLMTAQNYEPFNVLNINNAVTDLAKDGIQAIEAEKLVDLGEDIDIMIIDAAAIKNILPLYGNDPTMFDTIKAWQEGEVYLEMAYNAYYTNLEIALINTWYYGKVVYPDLFEDVDIDAKMSEVTLAFLGQDLTEAIKACGSSYGGYQKIDVATFFN